MTDKIEKIRIARAEFVSRVEELAQGSEYLEAIAKVCLENNIDEITAAEFVTGSLFNLVKQEAMDKKLLPSDDSGYVPLDLG